MNEALCGGDWILGTACGKCARCSDTAANAIAILRATTTQLKNTIAIGENALSQVLQERNELQQKVDAGRVAGICEVAAAFANLPAIAVGIRAMVANSGMRWYHVGRGTTYTELGRGPLQISSGHAQQVFNEGDRLVVYIGTDGRLWFRSESEFEDGRFERITE